MPGGPAREVQLLSTGNRVEDSGQIQCRMREGFSFFIFRRIDAAQEATGLDTGFAALVLLQSAITR